MKPEQFKNLAALRAREYLQKIHGFIKTDFPNRRSMLRVLDGLVLQLEKPLEELDKSSPIRYLSYLHPLRIISSSSKNETVKDAFLRGRKTPCDRFGNPKMLGRMYAGFLGILLATCAGIKSFMSWTDWKKTNFNSLMLTADAALGKTAVQIPADLKRLIPLMEEIKKELAKFPPNKKLEHLINK